MEKTVNDSSLIQSDKTDDLEKKITVVAQEKDSCHCKKDKVQPESEELRLINDDPRFQQMNQTQRCFVMYTDFYRCEHLLGEGTEACEWFKEIFTTICPNEWVSQWDELRTTGRLPWHKYKTQGAFPGNKYGD